MAVYYTLFSQDKVVVHTGVKVDVWVHQIMTVAVKDLKVI